MVSLFEFVCGSVHGCCMRIDSQKLTARVASSNSTLWQGRSRQTFRLVLACPDICLRVPKLNRKLEVQYVRRGPRAAAFRSSAHYVGNVSYDHVTHWLFKVDRESNHALRVHVNTLVSRGNPEFSACYACRWMFFFLFGHLRDLIRKRFVPRKAKVLVQLFQLSPAAVQVI